MKSVLAVVLLALFSLPQSTEQATIYFYRLEEVGRFQGNKPKVYIDDKLVLMLPESEYIGLKLPSGKHIIRMSGKRTETVINVEAGKTYFVRISRTGDGFNGMRDSLTLPTAEQAAFDLGKMKRAVDLKNVKSKDFETVKDLP